MKNMIHWNIFEGKWTSRTYKSCGRFDKILILGAWQTEVKKEKKDNPRGWVFADHIQVMLNPSEIEYFLSSFVKDKQLLYDKKLMTFNIDDGMNLLFDETGCHTLIWRDEYEPSI